MAPATFEAALRNHTRLWGPLPDDLAHEVKAMRNGVLTYMEELEVLAMLAVEEKAQRILVN